MRALAHIVLKKSPDAPSRAAGAIALWSGLTSAQNRELTA